MDLGRISPGRCPPDDLNVIVEIPEAAQLVTVAI
jgi:hypothetical protein